MAKRIVVFYQKMKGDPELVAFSKVMLSAHKEKANIILLRVHPTEEERIWSFRAFSILEKATKRAYDEGILPKIKIKVFSALGDYLPPIKGC